MKRFPFAWFAAAIALAAIAPPAFAQSASPSPAASQTSSATAFDGRYTGINTSRQGCKPGDFDLSVKNGSISGSVRFQSYARGSEHTFSYDASGSVAADGTATAQFHSDDSEMPANRRDFSMTGKAEATSMTLEQGGQTCAMSVTLERGK